MPIEFPTLLALVPLPFVLYALRQRGWKFLLPFAAFWIYMLALLNAVLFPIILPEPGVGLTFSSPWEKLATLYRHHNLNLIPFYFGETCWELPRLCRREIVLNILMTVPFGALYPLLRPLPARRIPLLALAVGLATEGAQLLAALLLVQYRSVDINDTLFNALGTLLGYGLLRVGQWTRRFFPPAPVTFPSQTRYTLQMNLTDPEAFAALYRQHLPAVYRYLYWRVSNAADAEDLTAQTFTEALEGLLRGRFRPDGNFAAWLFTIARRRAADHHRQRATSPLSEHPDPQPAPPALLEQREDLRRLQALLAQLDEEKRELLRLRFSAGLGFAEIALLEGKSEAAVKMAVYRALAWLREHWESDHE